MARVSRLVLALPFVAMASVARADVVTYSVDLGSMAAPVPIATATQVVDLPEFDGALGTLTMATFVIEGEEVPSLTFPFQNLTGYTLYASPKISFSVGGGPTQNGGNPVAINLFVGPGQLPPSVTNTTTPVSAFVESFALFDLPSVTSQDGTGLFTISTSGSTVIGGGYPPGFNPTGVQDNTGYYGSFEVVYSYDVPEPSSAAILFVPVAALLLARRGKPIQR